jgi:hypothetical protein
MKSFLSVLILAVTVMVMSSEAQAGRRCRVVQSCKTQCVTTCEVKVSKCKVKKCKVVQENCCAPLCCTSVVSTQAVLVTAPVAEAAQVAPAVTEEPLAPMVPSDKP